MMAEGTKKEYSSSLLDKLNEKAAKAQENLENSHGNKSTETNNVNRKQCKRKKSIDGNLSDTNFIVSDCEQSNRGRPQTKEDVLEAGFQVTNITSSPKKKRKQFKYAKLDSSDTDNNNSNKENSFGTLKIRQDLMNDNNNNKEHNEEKKTVKDDQQLEKKLKNKKSKVTKDQTQNEKSSTKNSKARRRGSKRLKKAKVQEFMKMGVIHPIAKVQVQRVLPYWLTHPKVVGQHLQADGCPITAMPFLKKELVAKLKEDGISRFFPVQRMLIPELLCQAGCALSRMRANDVCVSAATGSGKTLAYLLPILQTLSAMTAIPVIRALIILPTEQLAMQILRVCRKYGSSVGVRVGAAIGSSNFQQERSELVVELEAWELDLLPTCVGNRVVATHKALVHVVVATPDRLKDHIALTPGFDLSHLRYLVFDEADRLVSGDGGQWINGIIKSIEAQQLSAACPDGLDVLAGLAIFGSTATPVQYAHKLLISATLSCDPEKLEAINLFDPILFTTPAADPGVAHKGGKPVQSAAATEAPPTLGFTRPATLKEQYIVVEQSVQPLMLHYLIISQQWKQAIVFTNTKEAAHKLALLLQALSKQAYNVGEFSSKLGRLQKRMAENFRKGTIDVLVSTDSLSRGIDFSTVEAVINYDPTHCRETYVHRAGRTARAGNNGLALTMLHSKTYVTPFKSMLSSTGLTSVDELTVNISELHHLEQHYQDSLTVLKNSLEEEKVSVRKRARRNCVGIVPGKRKVADKHETESAVQNNAAPLNV